MRQHVPVHGGRAFALGRIAIAGHLSRRFGLRAERAAEPRPAPSASEGIGTAQNRTKGLIRADEYRPATASEETRALRVMRDHADLWDEAQTFLRNEFARAP